MESRKKQIDKQADIIKDRYDQKYQNKQLEFEIGESDRLKSPLTRQGLKKKLRNDNWGPPRKITKIISPENNQIENKEILNVNNIKKIEPKFEFRATETVTRIGRVSRPRIN